MRTLPPGPPISLQTIALSVFFASGFSALVYQVVWVRMLDRVFGITTLAASTVLGAYFGGLALGGIVGGRLAYRRAGLPLFAAIEIALGLTALAVPDLLESLTGVYRALHAWTGDRLPLLVPARFLLSFVVLVVPATLIGMSLPVLTRTLASRADEVGHSLPRLYGWNTFGSLLGVLLTGYVLIGLLGVLRSMYIAVVVNLVIGAIALATSRALTRHGRAAPHDRGVSPPRDMPGRHLHRAAMVVTFCSGFAALAYEVAWFRVLVLLSDHRAHSFSAIVAVVLLGIAAGSLVLPRVNRHADDPVTLLALVMMGLGALGALWLPLITGVSWVVEAVSVMFVPLPSKSGVPFAASLAVTLVPCVLMGMSFPLAVQVYMRGSGEVGRSVGRMYSLNLIGASLGSVAAGFLLLPLLGAQRTLFVLSIVCFSAAGLLLYLRRRPAHLYATGGAAAVAAGLALFSTSGIFEALFTRVYPRAQVVQSREDIEATVTLAEHESRLVMYVNGAHQADNAPHTIAVHRLIGLVPSVLHGSVRDALVVGMGGGTTSGEIAQFAGNTLTIVEISPGVVDAARAFAVQNRAIVDSPKARMVIGDGRNYLLLTDRRFDLITADTIRPIHAHSSNVYSLDYYRLMAARLKENGLVGQWIDGSLREHEQRILMRTFVAAFPHVAAWEREGVRLLLGSNQPLPLDRDAVADGTVAGEIFPFFSLKGAALRSAIALGPIVSDDRPLNEYFNLLRLGNLWKLLPVHSAAYRP